MTYPQLYEASKLRKYSDGTVGTEYRLIQGEGNLGSFLDEHGILWLEQPIDEVAKALVEEWMAGELSMGIDKDGEMVWQQRSKKFPQSELVELAGASVFDKELFEGLRVAWAGYKEAEPQMKHSAKKTFKNGRFCDFCITEGQDYDCTCLKPCGFKGCEGVIRPFLDAFEKMQESKKP